MQLLFCACLAVGLLCLLVVIAIWRTWKSPSVMLTSKSDIRVHAEASAGGPIQPSGLPRFHHPTTDALGINLPAPTHTYRAVFTAPPKESSPMSSLHITLSKRLS